MKKIVALALCLVLALSLCATAFASTNGAIQNQPVQTGKNWSLKTYHANGGNDAVTEALVEATDSVAISTRGDDTDDDGVVTKYATKIVLTGTKAGTYAEVAEDYADYCLSKGDVKYFLIQVAADAWISTTKTASGTVSAKAADERECGDYVDDGVMINGTLYATTNPDSYAVLNGKFVPYDKDTTIAKEAHYFTSFETKNTSAGKAVITSVKCKYCNDSFKVVTAAGLDKDWKVDVNYVALSRTPGGNKNVDIADAALNAVYGTCAGNMGGQLYAVINDGTTAAATTTTAAVSSAKTFDAGIAMYVGMSIMAVTGSAVVIGKKKEF